MSAQSPHDLTPRQQQILLHVVAEYIATGHPVGSKSLVEQGVVEASSSTVRYELAELEGRGLLDHPHTSAGRIPTDAGYRLYAEGLLERHVPALPLGVDLLAMQREIDSALRTTTEMLSQVTHLLAVVTAPPLEAAEIRHVEVLRLQPQVVMVVVITSTGGVTKRIVPFRSPIDAKLVEWAGEYLNEQLTDVRLSSRVLRQRLFDPGLGASERGFLEAIEPAFAELIDVSDQAVYVGGTSALMAQIRWSDIAEINQLMRTLEERASLLELLHEALDSDRLYLRIGAETGVPELRRLAVVAANYGLVTRNLGTVSLIGPTRMDYARVIGAVRGAAAALSEFVEDVYEG
jgi:heat-inducible transcriptional repressor